jgi:hypothetical protein
MQVNEAMRAASAPALPEQHRLMQVNVVRIH